jgi:hypothetical protein
MSTLRHRHPVWPIGLCAHHLDGGIDGRPIERCPERGSVSSALWRAAGIPVGRRCIRAAAKCDAVTQRKYFEEGEGMRDAGQQQQGGAEESHGGRGGSVWSLLERIEQGCVRALQGGDLDARRGLI